jgi:hypothetical protein
VVGVGERVGGWVGGAGSNSFLLSRIFFSLFLNQIKEILKKGSKYRFFCPNYDFPYEPHFGKMLWKRKRGSFYLPSFYIL